MSRPFVLAAWRLLTAAATPFAALYVRNRAARGKEDRARLNERLGMATAARPEGGWSGSMAPAWAKACRRCR